MLMTCATDSRTAIAAGTRATALLQSAIQLSFSARTPSAASSRAGFVMATTTAATIWMNFCPFVTPQHPVLLPPLTLLVGVTSSGVAPRNAFPGHASATCIWTARTTPTKAATVKPTVARLMAAVLTSAANPHWVHNARATLATGSTQIPRLAMM